MESEPPVNRAAADLPRSAVLFAFLLPSPSLPSPLRSPAANGRDRRTCGDRRPGWRRGGGGRRARPRRHQDGDDDGRGPGSSADAGRRPGATPTPRSRAAAASPSSQIYKQDAPGRRHDHVDDHLDDVRRLLAVRPRARAQQQTSQGSGFVIDKQGRILTNAHVVEGANTVRVEFEDGVSAKATVLGRDELYDLAVIKVDVPASELHPLDARHGRQRPGRRSGRRDRQPVRLRADRDRGHRLGQGPHPAVARGRRPHHPGRDPDRRRDQPRQLGRPADRPPRRRDRHQRADRRSERDGHERQRRRRLRDPDRPRQARALEPRAGQARVASVPRHPRRRPQQLALGRQQQAALARPPDRGRGQGLARGERRPRAAARRSSRSAARPTASAATASRPSTATTSTRSRTCRRRSPATRRATRSSSR